MTEITTPPAGNRADWLEEPKKMSETLNVVSILTFVGSGIAILSQIYSFFTAKGNYEKMLQNRDQFDKLPDSFKKLLGSDPVEMARKTMEYRVPMTIVNIAAAVLCIYGAVQMRNLKKSGFGLYVIGELLPFVAYVVLIGVTGSLLPLIFSVIIAAVFITLYATQLKHLS